MEAEIKACNKIHDEIKRTFRNVSEERRKSHLQKEIDEHTNGLKRIQTTLEALRPTDDGSLKSDVDVEKLSSLGSSGATPNDYINDDVIKTSLCGRDGRTICGPLCVPKSTCVSL